jgi:diaminohydroxyphosphoribosylaminopyrimidine deaminase/5-amino-6-(5-phosphoribosylamino)uracil reductase
LLDKVAFFVAPRLIGGAAAPSPVGGGGAACVPQAVSLGDVRVAWSGPDMLYIGYPQPEEPRHD